MISRRHEHQRRRPECPYFHCIASSALDDGAEERTSSSDALSSASEDETAAHSRRDPSPPAAPSAPPPDTSVVLHDETPPSNEPPAPEAAAVPASQELLTGETAEARSLPPPHSTPPRLPSEDTPGSDAASPAHASQAPGARVVSASFDDVSMPDAAVPVAAPVQARNSQRTRTRVVSGMTVSSAPTDESNDEVAVESMISSPPTAAGPEFSLPNLEDFLPVPFPHRRSDVEMPPMPDPRRVTVLEWITQQQDYLLDTMRERIETRLASLQQRNAEERVRLEKTLRS